MIRLFVLLAVSHLLLVGSLVSLYFEPNGIAAVALAFGTFIRWMVPHRRSDEPLGFRTLLEVGICGLFGKWLFDIGLEEFIAKAWDERLSTLPILGFLLSLLCLVVSDWLRVMKMSESEVSDFYRRK